MRSRPKSVIIVRLCSLFPSPLVVYPTGDFEHRPGTDILPQGGAKVAKLPRALEQYRDVLLKQTPPHRYNRVFKKGEAENPYQCHQGGKGDESPSSNSRIEALNRNIANNDDHNDLALN